MQILLADSNKENRERLRDLLQSLNSAFNNELHIVKEVQDGRVALAESRKGIYDLVFCDSRLPGLPALPIIQELKKQGLKSKVIIYGPLEELEVLTLALAEGALGYMLRPFRRSDIERLLKKGAQYFEQLKSPDEIEKSASRNQTGEINHREFFDWVVRGEETITDGQRLFFQDFSGNYVISVFQIKRIGMGSIEKFMEASRSILGEKEYALSVDRMDRVILFMWNQKNRLEILDTCEKIMGVGINMEMILTCGVGEMGVALDSTQSSYRGALYALECLLNEGQNSVLPIWLIENRETPVVYWCDNLETEMVRFSLVGNKEKARECVLQMKEFAIRHGISPKFMPKAFLALMLKISRMGEEHSLSFENIFADTFSTRKLAKFTTLEECFEYLAEGILAVSTSAFDQLKNRRTIMAEAVLRHVREHIRKGVSVENMSEKLGLLPAHLDKLTLDAFQIGLKDLIMREKMSTAKDLVLERELDDSSIALALGIEIRKFHELFYKYHGCSTFEIKRKD